MEPFRAYTDGDITIRNRKNLADGVNNSNSAAIAPVMISQFSSNLYLKENIAEFATTEWDVVQCEDSTVIMLIMIAHEDAVIIESYDTSEEIDWFDVD